MKRLPGIIIGIVVSVVAIALALNGVPLDQVSGQLAHGQYFWTIPCLVLSILGLFFRAVRWRALLDYRMSLGHSFNIINVGYFLNALLPLRLGEVARVFLTTRLEPPIPIFTALSTIVVERLVDTALVVLMIVGALSVTPNVPETVRSAAIASGAIAVVGLAVLIVFAVRRAWAQWLVALAVRIVPPLARLKPDQLADRLLDGIAPLTRPRSALVLLGWTLIAWGFSITAAFSLMPTFYNSGDWTASVLMIALASLAIAFPAVPGSIGPFELAVVAALAAVGLVPDSVPEAKSRAVAFAVVIHVVNILSYVLTGYYGLIREKIGFGALINAARSIGKSPVEREPTPIP
jgi:uncharacterized protein (TIRG00374 family)